jgi:hypothetical protein
MIPLNLISLGAGVQSSTMALMAAKGILSPMPDGAIFADTGDEPGSVYRWLEYLKGELPFPVYTMQKGVISEDSLIVHTSKKTGNTYIKSLIPAFVLQPDGKKGLLGRKCTADYKVAQIMKKARELVADSMKEWRAKHKDALRAIGKAKAAKLPVPMDAWRSVQADPLVIQWIGISTDESHRMKESRIPWAKSIWPLIDAGIRRKQCLAWMRDNGYPEPPRSACVYCPFHSDAEWRRLKKDEPHEFERAVKFEKDLQHAASQQVALTGVPYLTRRCVPLGTIDFSENQPGYQQVEMFGNECEGLCGV